MIRFGSHTVLVLVCFCSALLLVAEHGATKHARKKVVIISFDGFRWDYFGKFDTPHLQEMARNGVHAEVGIRPAFTTKTFPNHYTLATGLYEESHGIIDNEMYDPVFNETFTQRNLDYKWWKGGEPLWITATKQNITSGVLFWPGDQVRFQPNNMTAKYTMAYMQSMPFRDRVDIAIDWLTDKGVDLAMLYFHEPDKSGHMYGAASLGVEKVVKEVDDTVGYLFDRLKETKMINSTDVIVVSDHGMANRTRHNYIIDLSQLLNLEDEVQMVVPKSGPVVGLLPRRNTTFDVDAIVAKLRMSYRQMRVFKKEEIPDEFHYKNNRRVMPIVLVANEGYVITRTISDLRLTTVGFHGYDNHLLSMRPIFFASGPDFKKGYEFDNVVENVNLYPLACHLLGIQPAPNNGSLAAMQPLLRSS